MCYDGAAHHAVTFKSSVYVEQVVKGIGGTSSSAAFPAIVSQLRREYANVGHGVRLFLENLALRLAVSI